MKWIKTSNKLPHNNQSVLFIEHEGNWYTGVFKSENKYFYVIDLELGIGDSLKEHWINLDHIRFCHTVVTDWIPLIEVIPKEYMYCIPEESI